MQYNTAFIESKDHPHAASDANSNTAPRDLTPEEVRKQAFRQTEIYKVGQRMQAIGNLLCNSDTTLAELVDVCNKLGYKLDITLDYDTEGNK